MLLRFISLLFISSFTMWLSQCNEYICYIEPPTSNCDPYQNCNEEENLLNKTLDQNNFSCEDLSGYCPREFEHLKEENPEKEGLFEEENIDKEDSIDEEIIDEEIEETINEESELISCQPESIVSFRQGFKKDGSQVAEERSFMDILTDNPDNPNSIGFLSLGLGGEIVFEFSTPLTGLENKVLEISETSYNPNGCAAYPEKARIEASEDGQSWVVLGEICQSGSVVIQNEAALFLLKITDISDPNNFPNSGDGFDLAGIEGTCLR